VARAEVDFADSPCPKGGKHRVKFNGGNPLCIKCGTFAFTEGGTIKLPATISDDGTVTVHDPLMPESDKL